MNFNIKSRYYKYFDKYTTNKLREENQKTSNLPEDIPFYAKVKPDTNIQVTFSQFKLITTILIIYLQFNTLWKVLEPFSFIIKTYDQLLTLLLFLYYIAFSLFLNYTPLKFYFNWLTVKVTPSLNGLIWFQIWLSLESEPDTFKWYNNNGLLFWVFLNLQQSSFSITIWEFHSLHLRRGEYFMNLIFDLLYPIVPLLVVDFTRILSYSPPLIRPILPVPNPALPSIFQLTFYQIFQLALISITSGIVWIVWVSFIKFQFRALVWIRYLEEGYLIFKTQGQYKLAKIN